jgi:hypothetical protein
VCSLSDFDSYEAAVPLCRPLYAVPLCGIEAKRSINRYRVVAAFREVVGLGSSFR